MKGVKLMKGKSKEKMSGESNNLERGGGGGQG
jgi:hypothetical protein